MPSAQKLAGEFKARGLDVLLVSFREDPALVKRVAAERAYTGRVLVDGSGDVSGRLYGVFGPPTVYLIDRQGRLVARGAGPRDWDSPAARAAVEALVNLPGGR